MPFQAKHRFARIAPRKARLLMNLIRGRDVDDAITMLRFSKQRASGMIEKVVRSAVANAVEQEVALAQRAVCRQVLGRSGSGDQAVPAEGSRQGVFDSEAHQPPGGDAIGRARRN